MPTTERPGDYDMTARAVVELEPHAVALRAPEQRQGDLYQAASIFAERARNYREWERGLRGGLTVGESQYLNGVRERSRAEGDLRTKRKVTAELLAIKFPGQVTEEVSRLIAEQDSSMPLLDDWFRAAARATTFAEFLAVLQR